MIIISGAESIKPIALAIQPTAVSALSNSSTIRSGRLPIRHPLMVARGNLRLDAKPTSDRVPLDITASAEANHEDIAGLTHSRRYHLPFIWSGPSW